MTRSLLALLGALITVPLLACPFCSTQGQTLLNEFNQANVVAFGTLKNAKRDPARPGTGTTEFDIENLIKPNPLLPKKETVTLPRYVPEVPGQPVKHLIFFEAYNGKLESYRGESVPANSKIGEYLEGAVKVREKSTAEKLAYFFPYLDNADPLISVDALMEFGNADYKDIRPFAENAPADVVAKWVADDRTPSNRLGLYGSLLGHCGKPEHAELIRKVLADPKRRTTSGLDGVIAGLCMLDPKGGWAEVEKIFRDTKEDFLVRYATLRAVAFFWEYRPDVISHETILRGMEILLDQGDIADLAMDNLRKWKQSQYTDRILGYYGKESHAVPIVERAMIRFALSQEKTSETAKKFLAEIRKTDADRVRDIEELLSLEQKAADAAKTPPAPKK